MNTRSAQILAVAICLVTTLYLPASAGINQAFALQSLTESPVYQNMPQSPGNLTIYGQWKYYPKLSMPYAPAANRAVAVTCNVSSIINAPMRKA